MSFRRVILFVTLGLATLIPAPAVSEAAPDGVSSTAPLEFADFEGGPDAAPVIVDHRRLFVVRGTSAFPATDRAARITARIVNAARDETIGPGSVRAEEAPLGTQLLAGSRPLMVVTDADAELERVPRTALASLNAERIETAIARFRDDRSPRRLGSSALYVAGATALLVALLFVAGRLRRGAVALLERRFRDRLKTLRIQSVEIVQQDQMWRALVGAIRGAHTLVLLVLLFVWLNTVLRLFPWTRGMAHGLLGYVLDPLRTVVWAVLGFIPDALFLLVLIFVTRALLKVLHLLAGRVEQGVVEISGFDREWAWPTYRIVRFIVLLFAVVVSYPYIPGSDSLAFKGVSLFVGVLFSLGSSSVIGNLIAGYTMTYRRAFKIGDRIKVEDVVGDVVETRVLVTHLRSPKNEELVIPNSVILGGTIVNYSSIARTRGLILHTTVGIGYEVPWRQVEAMLLEAAGRTPGLLKEPKPFVLQRALGDFAVTYEINGYTDDPSAMMATYASLHRSILDVFNEYGVQIMTPAYEGDPSEPKIVPKEKWHEAPARPGS